MDENGFRLLDALITAGGVGVGWFLNDLWKELKALKKDHNALEVNVAGNYAKKAELEAGLGEIKRMLDRIWTVLDSRRPRENGDD